MVESAGILLHRGRGADLEVLIAHMGGPFWARKDEAAWSIPKGEFDPGEETAEVAARREFREELGVEAPAVSLIELGAFRYSSGKHVTVFAGDGTGFAAPADGFGVFVLEWPPRSGLRQEFPEVDRAEWMPVDAARDRLVAGQRPVLEALLAHLSAQ